MGKSDIKRQSPNVFRMLLGAEIRSVTTGSKSFAKDVMNEALFILGDKCKRHFLHNWHYVAGPHPYPAMVRDFQSIIGEEVRKQIIEAENKLPDLLMACIGGGSNALGLFHEFLDDKQINDRS